MAFSAFIVMSFFIFPVSADDYFEEDTEYYEDFQEDVQPDEDSESEPEETVEETEPLITETEVFLPETTVNDIEVQLTNYITAGAIKIIGAYYGVDVPDSVALKIAEVVRPVVSDYNSVAVSEYVSAEIIRLDDFKGTATELQEIQNEISRGLFFQE